VRSTRHVAGWAAAALTAALIAVPGTAAATTGPHPAIPVGTPDGTTRPTPTAAQPPVRRLIVRMRDGATATAAVTAAAAALARAGSARAVRRLGTGSTLVVLSSPLSVADAWAVSRSLEARSDVLYAQPDLMMRPLGTASPVPVNDPLFARQWDLWDAKATTPGGYGVRAPAAWVRTRGSASVVVAVLDTGVTDHPDLPSSSFVPGYDFVSGDGPGGTAPFYTANDGDGRDADPHDPGDWITAAENAGTDPANGWYRGCPVGPSSWHGTHVTGTIVAAQDNGIGISGIAPDVKVEEVRVLGKCGGYTSDISDAITWAAGMHFAGIPDATRAAVISLSLGGPGACDPTTQAAISYADAHGTTVVVAAGNDGQSVVSTSTDLNNPNGSSPANCTGVIDVVATDRAGRLAPYSDFGAVAGSTVIAAPGGAGNGDANDILSTVNAGTQGPNTPGYAFYAGTSMATPHVAAAVALMESTVSSPLSPVEVARRLSATTMRFPTGSGCGSGTSRCGTGILDVATALPLAPAAPASLDAAASDGAVDLSWSAAAANGSRVTGYHVESQVVGSGSWQDVVADTGSTATTLHVAPLVNETTYLFRVTGINGVGAGAAATLSPAATPSAFAPAAPTVTGGVEILRAGWAPPPGQGVGAPRITGYSVRYRLAGTTSWSCLTGVSPACASGPTPTSATFRPWPAPLPAGRYEVRVATDNDSHGRGPFSPSGTATVTALAQPTRISGTTLRPFRDGFQDSVTVSARSNVPAAGWVRILTASGALVRAVRLPTAQSWAYAWTGRDARGRRVPDAAYRAQLLLSGRTSTPRVLATWSVRVASSRATTPVITSSSATVYPYRDGYLDTITISTTATVPATWRWTLVGPRGTVWTAAFSRRTVARVSWAGRGNHGVALPAGRYTLSATATGGEGRAATGRRTLIISAQRLRAVSFTAKVLPSSATPRALLGSWNANGGAPGSGLLAPGARIGFALPLPASVRGYAGLVVRTCSVGGGAPDADVHVTWRTRTWSSAGGDTAFRNVAGLCSSPMTTAVPPVAAAAPAASIFGGRVHVALENRTAGTGAWLVSWFTVSGTRYVLA
jgi:serine protease